MWRPFGEDCRRYEKKTVSNLLFEKILRSYEVSQRVHKGKEKRERREEKSGEDRRVVVDLNKKIRVPRQSQKECCNKQNIQDNGTTYYQQSGGWAKKNMQIECASIQDHGTMQHKQWFHLNQFQVLSQSDGFIVEQQKEFNQNVLDAPQNQFVQNFTHNSIKIDGTILFGDQQLSFLKLPSVRVPSIQVPSCLLGDEQCIENLASSHPANLLEENYKQEIEPIQEFINGNKTQSENKKIGPQIKNKISLRVLKRRLNKQSPLQILQDIIKHRRLLLDGSDVQDRQLLENALMSLIKTIDN